MTTAKDWEDEAERLRDPMGDVRTESQQAVSAWQKYGYLSCCRTTTEDEIADERSRLISSLKAARLHIGRALAVLGEDDQKSKEAPVHAG